MSREQWAAVRGIGHLRLTVTDIGRSREFYRRLFGSDPVIDFSDQVDEPGVREDQERFFGGSVFQLGEQVLGLRPVADPTDSFDSTRVGLDHVGLAVDSAEELHAAAARLEAAGVPHGEVTELDAAGMVILSVQDPDDINVELVAPLGG